MATSPDRAPESDGLRDGHRGANGASPVVTKTDVILGAIAVVLLALTLVAGLRSEEAWP